MKQIYMKKKIYMGLIVISIFLAIQSYRYCIWSEEYTYQLQEIDNGVYVQYHRVFPRYRLIIMKLYKFALMILCIRLQAM